MVSEYRCLLIGPSDVASDVKEVSQYVGAWNGHVGAAVGVRVSVVHWESHGTPDSREPAQPAINRQIVDDCDFAVALFLARLGTETLSGASGSVEEIDRMTTAGKPVLVYFSDAAISQIALKGDQYSKLQSYRERMMQKSFVWSYPDARTLISQLALHLTSCVTALRANEIGQPLPAGITGVATAPRPDVRVVASASLIGLPPMETVMGVSIQNHSPAPVHFGSLSLSLANGQNAFMGRDAIGTQNSPGTIAAGRAWKFFYAVAVLKEAMEAGQIVKAVAIDEIGRHYESDAATMQQVLKQLGLLKN